MDINSVSGEIIDGAITVHSVLGPGLLESAYKKCLEYELRKRGLKVLSNHKLGLRINFHVAHRKDGIRRIVNGL